MKALNRRCLCYLFACTVFFSTGSCFAGLVTLDFNGPPPSQPFSNYLADGFRLSPSCHYHIDPSPPGYLGTTWFGWDVSGCFFDGTRNPDYLGSNVSNPGLMYLDYSGVPFTLESLYLLSFGFDFGRLTSSNGGTYLTGNSVPGIITFNGPEWTHVDWLLFEVGFVGGAQGFDHIAFNVPMPEPSTLALLGISLAGLGFSRRKKA